MTGNSTVFVVDDDPAMRKSLQWLLESAGLKVQTIESAQGFLDQYDCEIPGCALVDVRMPGMSGLELQHVMTSQKLTLPVIVITGHGDVSMAVQAMKGGAFDFIEKPFDDKKLVDRINEAIHFDVETRRQIDDVGDIIERLDSLSPREREVMDLVVDGRMNKQIASDIGVTDKTVESHRAAVMKKMQATTAVELVRMVLAAKSIITAGATGPTSA